jgi:hypothetical protein
MTRLEAPQPAAMQMPRGAELFAAVFLVGAVIAVWGGLAIVLVHALATAL